LDCAIDHWIAPLTSEFAPETARLRFRRPVHEDIVGIYSRYASDPDVTRFLGWPRHRNTDDTRGFIAFSDSEWSKRPSGPLLLELKTTGQLLGSTGLAFDSPTSAMVGYVLAKDAWGQGYATEALGAMTTLASRLGVTHLWSMAHADHRASAHVLEKCGFRLNASFVLESFPNLGAEPQWAHRFVYPTSLKLEHLQGSDDVHACAHIMATSEPWITLQRTHDALVPVISDPAKEVHLVRDADGVAAFVIVDMRGPMAGYIQTIAVRADRRSSGLGAAILSAVEARIYARSPNVFLCVSSFNERAQKFYARLGYERIGVWRQYVVATSDEILMRKTISPLRTFSRA
jgi:RimJ/RimL family protein N-acetyltransferase